MTRDDIIRMMRSVCDTDKVDAWHNEFWTVTQDEIERFAALVAEREREVCARMVDHILKEGGGTYGDAIRARGEQEQPR